MDELTLRHCQVPPDYYDQGIKNDPLRRIWHKNRFAEVMRILDGTSPRHILDIGCHGGTFTQVISRNFPQAKVSAIDISLKAIEYARRREPKINFKEGTASQLPFPPKAFDLITCFDTFEHLPDSFKVLSEIKRVLVNQGEVIFTIPTESLLFRTVWFFLCRFGPQKVWQETHIHSFKGRKLDQLLESSGFEIKARKTINFGMLLLIKAQLE